MFDRTYMKNKERTAGSQTPLAILRVFPIADQTGAVYVKNKERTAGSQTPLAILRVFPIADQTGAMPGAVQKKSLENSYLKRREMTTEAF